MVKRTLFINGKFYLGTLNGVHRVADAMLRALDRYLACLDPSARPDVRLLVPRGCPTGAAFAAIPVEEVGRGTTQIWEQTTLPWRARGGVLVSLCNLGPILHPRQLLLIHDAQFWLPETSYPVRRRWGHRLLVPLMARRSRRVLTVSDSSRQGLEMARIVAPGAARVIHNGADHLLDTPPDRGVLDRLNIAPGGYILVFGSTKRYKNLSVVRDACRGGALDGRPLVVMGEDGGDAAGDAEVHAGAIGDAALRALYENAACFLYPSRTEGFGLPPLEAMLVGCPVVAAPSGAIPEVCRDAVLYAGVDDPAEWTAAIRTLREDGDLRQRKIAEGRSRAAEFTWAEAARRLLDEALAVAAA